MNPSKNTAADVKRPKEGAKVAAPTHSALQERRACSNTVNKRANQYEAMKRRQEIELLNKSVLKIEDSILELENRVQKQARKKTDLGRRNWLLKTWKC